MNVRKVLSDQSLRGLQEVLDSPEKRSVLESIISKAPTSFLFECRVDKFSATIIKRVDQELWRIDAKSKENLNLLQFFIVERQHLSIKALLEFDHPHVQKLVFERDHKGNTPLMSSLEGRMTTASRQIWRIMQEQGVDISEELNEALHLFTPKENNNLLVEILESVPLDKLQDIVFRRIFNGRTLLDMCGNESAIIKILELLQTGSSVQPGSFSYHDKDGRNLLHHWAENNFHNAIDLLQSQGQVSNEAFGALILEESSDGNNPPMVSALHNRKESLDKFLYHICLYQRSVYKKTDIHKILHHKAGGDTLLGLVLQQSGTLGTAELIILDLEKDYHFAEARKGVEEKMVTDEEAETEAETDQRGFKESADTEAISEETSNESSGCLHRLKRQFLFKAEFQNHPHDAEIMPQNEEQKERENEKVEASILEEGKKQLTKCLREHLVPSQEVQNALHEVDTLLPKTTLQKVFIWMRVFLMSLFIPVLLLCTDVAFDGILVYKYRDYEDSDLEDHYKSCRDRTNVESNDTYCEMSMSATMPFVCSPLALDKYSRLNYSLAFVIIPWIFYCIEYGQSKYWEKSVEVNFH